MLTSILTYLPWQKTVMRSLIIGTLATVGAISGATIEFTTHNPQLAWQQASAQGQNTTYSESVINNFAGAVLAIEDLRNQAYEDIKKIVGTVPDLACHEPNSLNNLPSEARQIAVQYCNDSKDIVENSGISTTQFNELAAEAQSNESLTRRIQDAMIRLRQEESR